MPYIQKNTDYQIYTIYPPSEIAVLQPLTFFLFCYKYNKIIYIFFIERMRTPNSNF